jgi:hypothetical protein
MWLAALEYYTLEFFDGNQEKNPANIIISQSN